MADIKKQVDAYFSTHTKKDEVYGTADGYLFSQKGDAILHGKTLFNKKVSVYGRYDKTDSATQSEDSGDTDK